MNIMELGAIGEMVGDIAVLVTLVYLATQIRQNTRALNSGSHQANLSYWASMATPEIVHPEVAELARRGQKTPDELSEDEWHRFSLMSLHRFASWEQAFLNHREGLLDHERWLAWDGVGRLFFADPGSQKFWIANRTAHAPAFQRYVDTQVFPAESRS